jgi:short subunit fatty acids transporter
VPAQVARKVLTTVFGYEPPADKVGLITNVMHWGYGTSWGAVFGLVRGRRSDHALVDGLLFGAAVWAMSYVTLAPAGLYQPP